jgi:NADPH-dependent 2,4-dienoyl-CoA reductase/sulfur reductase-like enzyme
MEGFRNIPSLPTIGLSHMQKDLSLYHKRPSVKHCSSDMLRSAVAKSGPISVAIVGAGFAGLRCADILLQHGVNVTIFEARDRVGGRVAQSDHLGHVVDL